ncbi:MFS transporter [Pandoraea sp.]|uniref:MFS transporter n=1 Tax=Pandoraea sp. TaxID=1883445 RepID=UPI0011F7DA55|nr:MFS transporter [Pandoraea sp.]TAL54359.1 MAG: MFS transporter [Pandoraea sp.]TAM17409.1 MAG: MFS transporter [Pandoraea sp.]
MPQDSSTDSAALPGATSSSTPRLGAPFHRLAWSNLLAQSAEQIGLAAAPMVAVLSLGAGPGATGFLTALQSLPFLLLSFPAGVLADRFSRRRLMTLAELCRVVALLALPGLMLLGSLNIALLGLLGFAGATGTVAFSVAAPALVPALVSRAAWPAANGRLELARSAAFALGPALAGALIGWAGVSPAFVLAAALSSGAVLLLRGIAEPERPAQPPRHFWTDLKEGAGFAWSHPLLRPIVLTAVFWNLSWFVLQAAYVPYAAHVLGLSAVGIGTTLGMSGAGMVLGALLAPRVARHLSFGAAILIGPALSVGAAALMAATAWVHSMSIAAGAFFLFGAGPIIWTINQTTLRQTVTPNALLGRVSAFFMTANTGARPLGAALGGLVGASCGPRWAIFLAAGGFVIQAAIILGSTVARLERLPAPTA